MPFRQPHHSLGVEHPNNKHDKTTTTAAAFEACSQWITAVIAGGNVRNLFVYTHTKHTPFKVPSFHPYAASAVARLLHPLLVSSLQTTSPSQKAPCQAHWWQVLAKPPSSCRDLPEPSEAGSAVEWRHALQRPHCVTPKATQQSTACLREQKEQMVGAQQPGGEFPAGWKMTEAECGMTHWQNCFTTQWGKQKNPFFGFFRITLFPWGMARAGKLSPTFSAGCTVKSPAVTLQQPRAHTEANKYMIHSKSNCSVQVLLDFIRPTDVPPNSVPACPNLDVSILPKWFSSRTTSKQHSWLSRITCFFTLNPK